MRRFALLEHSSPQVWSSRIHWENQSFPSFRNLRFPSLVVTAWRETPVTKAKIYLSSDALDYKLEIVFQAAFSALDRVTYYYHFIYLSRGRDDKNALDYPNIRHKIYLLDCVNTGMATLETPERKTNLLSTYPILCKRWPFRTRRTVVINYSCQCDEPRHTGIGTGHLSRCGLLNLNVKCLGIYTGSLLCTWQHPEAWSCRRHWIAKWQAYPSCILPISVSAKEKPSNP